MADALRRAGSRHDSRKAAVRSFTETVPAVTRLRKLAPIVDTHGRPWRERPA